MSSAEGPASHRVVTALRRPPVRQSTLVRASVRHTFDTFVTTIGAWWPVQPFSAGEDRVRDITIEQRQGGRVYETWDDGTHCLCPSGHCRGGRDGQLRPGQRHGRMILAATPAVEAHLHALNPAAHQAMLAFCTTS